MTLRFPLSLKVSLWLLLNLVLLALLGGAFFVAQSGFGWDALVAGSSGRRLQAVADVIAAELRTEPRRSRDAVLERFSAVYGVEFTLFQDNGRQLAGPARTLPESVRRRLGTERPVRGAPGGETDARPASRSFNGPPPFETENGPPDDEHPAPPEALSTAPTGSPPPHAGLRGGQGERFLVRTAEPIAYWAGVRLPPLAGDFVGHPPPSSVLLLRAPSLSATALLLDLKPWLLAAAVALGFSVLFWLPLVRGITRALGQLTRATERIAEGDFGTRVDDRRRDELGRLGTAVNRMADRLDRLVTGQKRFLGDIAHELGSPLGRMQLGVGILEERVEPALQPAVADVREEVQHMSALVHELLAFTKAGLRARDAALARVELAPLVEQVLAREAAAEAVTTVVPPGLAVKADADLLARALGNLVRNALRYADGAGPITLSAQLHADGVHVTLDDCGPGVPAATLARLGEPFYRPELARTRETGGAGLGLAIVKSAVEACRGTVRFSNREPHGFRAELQLEAAPETTADFTHA